MLTSSFLICRTGLKTQWLSLAKWLSDEQIRGFKKVKLHLRGFINFYSFVVTPETAQNAKCKIQK
jgi:hypothetical protein